MLKLCCCFPQS